MGTGLLSIRRCIELGVIEGLVSQIFPHSGRLAVERVEEGVSTYVYRIRRDADVFYLRVLPEEGASFAPEMRVHELLKERGVKVPEVVYFEHCNQALQRSVMVTREIKGRHIGYCSKEDELRDILVEAGRDLAVINTILVKGFGWIKRDRDEVGPLEAQWATNRTFMFEYLEDDLAILGREVLSDWEIRAIREIVGCYSGLLDGEQSWLAHGDFDATHIYQEYGRYSGIIDFGEIRGTDRFYDLGHFRMHDGETLRSLVLPYLLEGYKEVVSLPADCDQWICLSSLLIGVRTLSRSLGKFVRDVRSHPAVGSIRCDIKVLRDR
jgi:aminoglycoside phosphotransferase (APT) family kinase protein